MTTETPLFNPKELPPVGEQPPGSGEGPSVPTPGRIDQKPGVIPRGSGVAPVPQEIAARTSEFLKKNPSAAWAPPVNLDNFYLNSTPGNMRFNRKTGQWDRPHGGDDLSFRAGKGGGNHPVTAARGGEAKFFDTPNTGQGYTVMVYDPTTDTTQIYMHLDPKGMDIMKGVNGQTVTQGQVLGYVGGSGIGADGKGYAPHLHNELRQGKTFDWSGSDRRLNPQAVQNYRKGTPGNSPTGQAAMDVQQMENMVANGASVNLNELLSEFNNNMTTLIALTEERKSIHQQQLDYTRQLSGNLIGA